MTLNHTWNVTPTEAIQIQKNLRQHVRLVPLRREVKLIAGADVSVGRFDTEGFAGIQLFTYPELEPKGYALAHAPLKFPYVPGLLSFREIPLLLECWNALPEKPDLVMVDGQGIAHPRRLGIATHFGLVADVPTIGVAKSVLVGEYDEPGEGKGSFANMYHRDEWVGMALRTKDRVNPVFVSPGHLITHSEAASIALFCTRAHRLPEPTRLAHDLVNKYRRKEIE